MENISPSEGNLDLEKIAQGADPARMLISPPPEEELRMQRTPRSASQSKRKRQPPLPLQLTPNPKPRKQVRNERTPSPTRARSPSKLVLHESPHVNNPHANYVPPDASYSSRRRSRSATPVIVPYEPPKDVFTPPREVLIVPAHHTPRRRSKLRPQTTPMAIKTEAPVIDLSEPMPPASPTDDPLLLRDPVPRNVCAPQTSLPPSTPPAASSPNWNTSVDSMDLDGPPVAFPIATDGGSWSDSENDSDVIEGEGEYTGKWSMMFVPTKTDPPSSATRSRMDSWGRPISPHPFRRRVSRVAEEEEEATVGHHDQSAPMSVDHDNELPVADYDDDDQVSGEYDGRKDDEDSGIGMDEDDQSVEEVDMPLNPDDDPLRVEENTHTKQEEDNDDTNAADEEEVRAMSVDPEEPSHVDEPIIEDSPLDDTPSEDEGDRAEEEAVRALSMERDDIPHPQCFSHHLATSRLDDAHSASESHTLEQSADDSDDGGEDDPLLDLEMVKITSGNPQAAARAVAILRQHNYDCFTKKNLRRDPRRKTFDGAIQKRGFSTPTRNSRRDTVGVVIGDNVFIPGSPVMTVEGLLQHAQTEVQRQSAKQDSPAPRPATPLGPEWSKDHWKMLDMCFTEERYEVGGGDKMADVDDVEINKVLTRFFDLVPEGEWPEDELEQRAIAIAKKQRGGKVAPPLTPRGSRILTGAQSPLDIPGRQPSMVVPDFTPLGRRAMPPARFKHATSSFRLPEPVSEGAPFQKLEPAHKVPSVLFAPRYSHLMDEAHAVAGGKPRVAATSQEAQEDSGSEEEAEEEEGSQDESMETNEEESVDTSMEESFEEPQEACSPAFRTPVPQTGRAGPRKSLGNRVKGFFYSYLPSAAKTAPVPTKRLIPLPNQLPPPPAELLDKARGPINTPVKPPGPKAKPPKELVDLNHIEAPKTKSMIPRRMPPKRLVDLAHVSPEKEAEKVVERPRRSSGASVKDMIKGFEELRQSQCKGGDLKRTRSVGEMKKKGVAPGRPVWK